MPKAVKKPTRRWKSKQYLDDSDEEQLPKKKPRVTKSSAGAQRTKAKKTINSRTRSKKLLRPSLINRLCQSPSRSRLEAVASTIAEVMYTNSEFDPSYYSEYGDWSMSAFPEDDEDEEEDEKPMKALPKRRRKAAEKPKPVQRKPIGVQRFMMKSLLPDIIDNKNNDDDNQDNNNKEFRKCLCTEVGGKVFKLMEFPLGLNDDISLNSYLSTMPRIVLTRRRKN